MKKMINVLLVATGCGALGLGIGAQVAGTDVRLLFIIPYIVAGVCLLTALVLFGFRSNTKRDNKQVAVNLKKQDLVLQAGTSYTVGKKGYVHSGQYQVLTTNENDPVVKIRVNDFVKDYQHNTTLVLADGDTISPRSANVILRQ